MRISNYVVTLHFKGIVNKAFRIGLARDYSKPVEETRKYVALGVSPDDARDRVRSLVVPMLNTQYESLTTTWGVDGDRGDVVELAKVDVDCHPGTNIPKD